MNPCVTHLGRIECWEREVNLNLEMDAESKKWMLGA